MSHQVLVAEIESWLISKALGDPDIVILFQKLCDRLLGAGVPVHRAALSWPMLHPLFRAEQIFWNPDDGAHLEQHSHAAKNSDAWVRSPFYYILQRKLDQLRRRLSGPDAIHDFEVLKELAGQGFTDYLMTSSEFRIGEVDAFEDRTTGILASWATKREDGFSDADLKALIRIQTAFAVACRVAIQRRVTANLVNTYLGPTAGSRTLSGEIRRGDGEQIRAVVYYADLRGSTQMSENMEGDDYLSVLKNYYDCVAHPVIEEGGEILDYIGDAVLAIFPVQGDTGLGEAARAATRAMEAALHLRDEAPEDQRLKFCISMAVGEVMFGNIGVPERLSFSVIGPVVNQVARMDDASKKLGRAVLATSEVAKFAKDEWFSLGHKELRGVSEPVELFARTCDRDAFDLPLAASA
ncbi:MAG: adenylate/guanylate cyclase domain-containing protein [Pseudomonadota bacterium]